MKAVTVCMEIGQKVAKDPLPVPGGGGAHATALLPFELFKVTIHGREHSHTSQRQKRNLALRNPFSSTIFPGFLFARPHVGQSCLIAPADPPKHEGVTKKGSLLVRKYFRGLGSPSSLRGLLSSLRPLSATFPTIHHHSSEETWGLQADTRIAGDPHLLPGSQN